MKNPRVREPSESSVDPADIDLPPTTPIDITGLLQGAPEDGRVGG